MSEFGGFWKHQNKLYERRRRSLKEKGGGERQTQRQRQTDRERESDRETERHRQTDRQTDRQRELIHYTIPIVVIFHRSLVIPS